MPLVTVVIPVHDRAAMVAEAIASVRAQTYRDLGIVVVDDGSSDGSAEAAEAALADATVPARVVRQPQRGVAAARNKGAAVLDARWIAFLDSDDLWLPQKLERQIAWLEARPEYRLAQTGERWCDAGRHRNPRQRHRKEERLFLRSLACCLVSPSAVVIARELFAACGGFDEAFAVCEDYELWLRLTACERVGLVPEALVVKRGGHPGQLSRSTWGLDRWRVAALVKLLATSDLGAAERTAVAGVVREKCTILAAGAERRGRREEAARYRLLGGAATMAAAGIATDTAARAGSAADATDTVGSA
jgi:glycosyltransferase involved in cell wall biosynthesis